MCEQDGPPERTLKGALVTRVLEGSAVDRAYLAQVADDNAPSYEVALCLRGAEDRDIVEQVGAVFSEQFGSQVRLDITFISVAEEAELGRVCKPFYETRER